MRSQDDRDRRDYGFGQEETSGTSGLQIKSGNEVMSMNPTALVPVATTGRKTFAWWMLPAVGLVIVGSIALWVRPWANTNTEASNGQFFTDAPIDLEVRINKDGQHQAVS